MIFVSLIKKHFKEALFKSSVAVLLYALLVICNNIEIIRDQAEDIAFDFLNYTYLDTKEEYIKGVPNIQLFKVDEMYLKINNLMDKDGETTFGYFTPRDKLAEMINRLDKLEEDKQPKILFLDYDFSFTSTPYGKVDNLSNEDQVFIDTLKQKRKYVIILPKTAKYNFIENSKDIEIQKLIKNEKLIFASVRFSKNKDKYFRRYYSSDTYDSKVYPNISLIIYTLLNNKNLDELKYNEKDKIKEDKKDIVKNKIIIKQYKEIESTPLRRGGKDYQATKETSYWTNVLTSKSVVYLRDKNTTNKLKDSIVFIGSTYKNSGDYFYINNSFAISELSGIEMHLNTLMSIFYFDNDLKPLNLVLGLILIFVLFFIVEIILEALFDKFNIISRDLEFVILLVIMTIIMYSLSLYLIQYYNIWFNWFVPVLLFQSYEVIELIKRYIVSKIQQKKEYNNV